MPDRTLTLLEVAQTSAALAEISGRTAKAERIAAMLRGLGPIDITLAVSYLTGELPQRQIGVGFAAVRDAPPAAEQATLRAAEVDESAALIGAAVGPGSQRRRRELLDALYGRASAIEQRFLSRLLLGDLRQGALAGVMTDAIARAFALPIAELRRASMLRGDLAAVAAALAEFGPAALPDFRLEPGRPVLPMLAQPAESLAEAMSGREVAIETKLDGVRLQIHRRDDEVRLFSRTLDDVTARLPEIVDTIRSWPLRTVVADGEAIALRPDGRPQPFQVTAARFGTHTTSPAAADGPSLQLFVFDLLHLDGTDLLDAPLSHRWAQLEGVIPAAQRVDHLRTTDQAAAQLFQADVLARAHEGVVVKDLAAPYEAGRRGAAWRKVKPVHTLDLVVLAVERGSGRRQRWLSNIHLGARDPDTGDYVMVGKTFKGMTDAMLQWQTERFTDLADGPTDGWVVHLRPDQVVEIAFDGVQRSTRYPGGVALRFARVVRYREDKPASQADTIDTLRGFRPD